MTLIIGFSGRARHGKSEASKAIESFVSLGKHYGFESTVRIYEISDIIRRYCISNNFLPPVERKDMTREQLEVLIEVGRKMRASDVDFWIRQVMQSIKEDDYNVALIPNIRYVNEAAAIRRVGGYVVKCTRLNKDGSTYISEDRPPNDPSETTLEFWPADFHLTLGEGHVELLRRHAVTLFQYIEGPR